MKNVEENYSQEEIKNLLKLIQEPGGKIFPSAEAFLQYIQKL